MTKAEKQQKRERELGELFEFFKQRGQTMEPLTTKDIRAILHCSLETIREYINTIWSSFLTKGKDGTFIVRGFEDYPHVCFIALHDPNCLRYILPPNTLSRVRENTSPISQEVASSPAEQSTILIWNILSSLKEQLRSEKDIAVPITKCHYEQARELQDLQCYKDALLAYQRAFYFGIHEMMTYSSRGKLFLDFKHHRDALASYDLSLLLKLHFTDIYIGQGKAFSHLELFEEALTSYEHALQLDPSHVVALLGKGDMLLKLNRNEDALTIYDQVIELEPRNVHAHNERGEVLFELEKYEEALEAYERAIELDPKNDDAHSNKGYVLFKKLQRNEEALSAYERAICLNTNFVENYFMKGEIFIKLERYKEALEVYEQMIALAPNDARAYNLKGVVLSDYLGGVEESLAAFLKAADLNAKVAVYHRNAGMVLHEMERYEEALDAYQRAIDLDPRDVYRLKGDTLASLKRYEEALVSYNHALRLEPTAENYCQKGHALYKLKRYKEAEAAYEKACALKPNDPDIHQYMSNVLDLLAKEASDRVKDLKKIEAAI